jgi:hypothetical protein
MAQTKTASTMTQAPMTTAVPARGKIIGMKDGTVVFAPTGTNYELYLVAPKYTGPVGTPIKGIVRAAARKIWTVPSGGNFISLIFGPPRTIQGRVRALDQQSIVVEAGLPIVIDLPESDTAIDLANGPISVGAIVNVMALPGARFEPVG